MALSAHARRTRLVGQPGPRTPEDAFERAHHRGPIVCFYTHAVLGLTHATCAICARLRAAGQAHACSSHPWER